jgi:hypothetical protein
MCSASAPQQHPILTSMLSRKHAREGFSYISAPDYFLAVGLIDGNFIWLEAFAWTFQNLYIIFLFKLSREIPKVWIVFHFSRKNLAKLSDNLQGPKTLKFKHRIFEKNKLICLDEDKSVFDPFCPLFF